MPIEYVEANGLRFRVIVEGAGPAVLLLHGFPDSADLWRHQIPALAAAGYRVIAPDLRGYGGSDRPTEVSAYAMPNLVGDVLGILAALGESEAHVVGHDWGGVLSWVTAAMAPQFVTSLTVLTIGHPMARADVPGVRQHELSWYLWMFLHPDAEKWLAADDWAFLRRWLGPDGVELERQIAALSEPGALTAGLSWYRANVDPAIVVNGFPEGSVPAVTCPTMSVWSSGDRFLSEEWVLASKNWVTGPWRYERIEDAEHWFPASAPQQTTALLLDWLSSQSRPNFFD
ncbi:MAG: alpha/beta fold hydrolase [Sporichthyaceae bacterium]